MFGLFKQNDLEFKINCHLEQIDGVVLRCVTPEDLELIRQWRMHPDVTNYMYTDPTLTKHDQIKWYKKLVVPGLKNGTDYYFVIYFRNQKVGLVSVTEVSRRFGAIWAFYLSPHVPRGKGIGKKVEYIVLNFVFNMLNIHKLRCEVFSTNEKVVKMHEKFGFQKEGYSRQHVLKYGKPKDVVQLAMLKEEWDNGLRNSAYLKVRS